MSAEQHRARKTYALERWGEGYFDINGEGHLVVRPDRDGARAGIDLCEVIESIHDHGFGLPVLLRFPGILQHRVQRLDKAFRKALDSTGYQGGYQPAYPIKVNQQKSVVQALLQTPDVDMGLEAGSKPELMAVLALSRPGGTVICNGYKDREYIRLALIGRALGLNVYIVVEKLSELDLVLSESSRLSIEPLLGVRLRLSSISRGKWQNSGGVKSKFGLTSGEVVSLLDRLKKSNSLHGLKLLHFHMGSQVANIRDIKTAVGEACRHLIEINRFGADVEIFDVGGGLAVDYDGTASRNECSRNYELEDYANAIVSSLKDVCTKYDQREPKIVTEAGRAMTAHHAMLVTNAVEMGPAGLSGVVKVSDDSDIATEMKAVIDRIGPDSAVELLEELKQLLEEGRQRYLVERLDLTGLASLESIFLQGCNSVRANLDGAIRSHRQPLDEVNELLADKLFCNFSLFQSMPDVWGIEQLFPIVPLRGLLGETARRVIVEDLTCDSDGRIDQYVDGYGVENSLPLPDNDGQPYLIGFFLLGAYQEILGDMHNLFGDTHSVNVLEEPPGFRLEDPLRGDGVDKLLRYVHFDPQQLISCFREKLNESDLDDDSRHQYEIELIAGLSGYSYLED